MGLETSVSKSWEAYGDKGVVFYQHLEPLDKAQENFSKLIALNTAGASQKEKLQTSIEFITNFLKIAIKSKVKMQKYSTHQADIKFGQELDNIVDTLVRGRFDSISLINFESILFGMGMLYDRLGYNSPERLKIRTSTQSDIQVPGTEKEEEMMVSPEEEGRGVFGT